MKIKTSYLIIGLIVLILAGILLQYNGFLFAIGENDLISTGTKTEEIVFPGEESNYINCEACYNFSNFTIVGMTGNLSFIINGVNKTYQSGSVFFMIDTSPTIYNSFLDVTEGTHTLKRYQMTIWQEQINIQKWQKTYDIVLQTVIVNHTIPNETFYVINQTTVYIDRNVTQYINQTVETQVLAQPDIMEFFNKYKLYIIGIAILGFLYYVTRRKK